MEEADNKVKKPKIELKSSEKFWLTVIGIALFCFAFKGFIYLRNIHNDKVRLEKEDILLEELNSYSLDKCSVSDAYKKYIENIKVSAKRTITRINDGRQGREIESNINVKFTDDFDKMDAKKIASFLIELNKSIESDFTAIRDDSGIAMYFEKNANHFTYNGVPSYYRFFVEQNYSSNDKSFGFKNRDYSRYAELSINDNKGGKWDKYRYEYDYHGDFVALIKTDSSWDDKTEKKEKEAWEEEKKRERASKPPYEGMPEEYIKETLYGPYTRRESTTDYSKYKWYLEPVKYIWAYPDGEVYCTVVVKYKEYEVGHEKHDYGYVDSVQIKSNAPDKKGKGANTSSYITGSGSNKNQSKTSSDAYHVDEYDDAQSFADDKYEEFYDYEDDYEDEDEAYEAAEDYWYEHHDD